MSILIHRNVNVAELLELYNAELDPEDHYDAASVLCLDHMGEAWDDWPEGCNTELVTYIGHKINTTDSAMADVFMRIAPAYPAWDTAAYCAAFNAEVLPMPQGGGSGLPDGIDYSMLGSDGR